MVGGSRGQSLDPGDKAVTLPGEDDLLRPEVVRVGTVGEGNVTRARPGARRGDHAGERDDRGRWLDEKLLENGRSGKRHRGSGTLAYPAKERGLAGVVESAVDPTRRMQEHVVARERDRDGGRERNGGASRLGLLRGVRRKRVNALSEDLLREGVD